MSQYNVQVLGENSLTEDEFKLAMIAANSWYRRYRNIWHYGRYTLDDLKQIAMLAAYRSRFSHKPEKAPKHWYTRMYIRGRIHTAFKAIDLDRTVYRMIDHEYDDGDKADFEDMDIEFFLHSASTEPDPHDVILLREVVAFMQEKAKKHLGYRLLYHVAVENWTQDDLCVAYGIGSVHSVTKYMDRARQDLISHFGTYSES